VFTIDVSLANNLKTKYEKEVNDILGKYKDDDMLAKFTESDKILSDDVVNKIATKATTDDVMKAITKAIN
jgi:hypothetical protein